MPVEGVNHIIVTKLKVLWQAEEVKNSSNNYIWGYRVPVLVQVVKPELGVAFIKGNNTRSFEREEEKT